MIRRDGQETDGTPRWILLSQVAHARIAGEVAQSWGADPYPALAEQPVLVEAIFRHDDGWRAWEARPTVDPALGRPRSFLEMPDREALEIWRRSIDSVDDLGPLAQAIVAGHFAWLRGHSDDPPDSPGGKFVREMTENARQWQAAWIAEAPDERTTEEAEAALEYLRMFDVLSLWLCCSEPTEPFELAPPTGPPVTLTPTGEGRIRLAPWPLVVDALPLSITGRSVPACRYPNADALADAESQPAALHWELVPR